jgi:hypothetical protein
VVAIREELASQGAARAQLPEHRGRVDQDRVGMARRDLMIDVQEVRHAAYREAVAIARRHVVLVRLFPSACGLEQASQPVVGLGEPGLACEQRTIGGDPPDGIGLCGPTRGLEVSRKPYPFRPCGLRRQGRPIRLEIGIVPGRGHEHHQGS